MVEWSQSVVVCQGSGRLFRSGLPRGCDEGVDQRRQREDRLATAGGVETGGGFSCARVLPGSPEGQCVWVVKGRQIVMGTAA